MFLQHVAGACLVSAHPKRIISIGHSHKILVGGSSHVLGMLTCILYKYNILIKTGVLELKKTFL